MKTIKIVKLLPIIFCAILIACSSSKEEPKPVSPSSIVLTSNTTSIDVGAAVTFTVKTNLNAIVTSEARILVNNSPISGTSFSPSTSGSYKVKAEYKNLTSNEITVNVSSPVVSIAISSNVTTVEAGDLVTFTAMATLGDNTVVDKTSDCTFYINGQSINGAKYLLTELGENKIKATINSVTSPEVKVQVTPINLPSDFTKKSVIEDYTGTWCGWCPRVSRAIELVKEQTDNVFSVGVHLANGDPMENDYSKALRAAYGVSSFPTAYLNREVKWSYPETTNINQALNYATGKTNLGLGVNSNLSGSTLNIVVNTGFTTGTSGAKIVVFVLEDKVKYPQYNYTTYYNGINPISNFQHDNVLRYSATNVLGDATDTSTGVHLISYNVDLSNKEISNYDNVRILAMLVDDTGKKVLNAQYSKINEDVNFD